MEINLTYDKEQFTLLLISDTHIYSEKEMIPDTVTELFRASRPDLIIHCGDICSRHLTEELGTIADVYAVRGNRDIRDWSRLPSALDICVNGFRIHAEHGQGNFFRYLRTKIYYTFCRVRRRRPDFRKIIRISPDFQKNDLYCFGHTHDRYLEERAGTILLNPGHLNFSIRNKENSSPSFALLRVSAAAVIIEETVFSPNGIMKKTHKYSRSRFQHGMVNAQK